MSEPPNNPLHGCILFVNDVHCNNIDSNTFGKLQVLKYAYKTNFLNASDEAEAYEPFKVIELD